LDNQRNGRETALIDMLAQVLFYDIPYLAGIHFVRKTLSPPGITFSHAISRPVPTSALHIA
jgi:hypothetical protein